MRFFICTTFFSFTTQLRIYFENVGELAFPTTSQTATLIALPQQKIDALLARRATGKSGGQLLETRLCAADGSGRHRPGARPFILRKRAAAGADAEPRDGVAATGRAAAA